MGGVIDQSCHTPQIVAMSSAEAEYNGACAAAMAVDHHRMLLNELDGKDPDDISEAIPILLDSASAIAMAKHAKDTKHTRHIARRLHYVREGEQQSRFSLSYIPAEKQLADIGTKALSEEDMNSRYDIISAIVDI